MSEPEASARATRLQLFSKDGECHYTQKDENAAESSVNLCPTVSPGKEAGDGFPAAESAVSSFDQQESKEMPATKAWSSERGHPNIRMEALPLVEDAPRDDRVPVGTKTSDETVEKDAVSVEECELNPQPGKTADDEGGSGGRGDASDDVEAPDVTAGSCGQPWTSLRRHLREGSVRFLLACFVGVVLGFSLGLGLRPLGLGEDAYVWLGLPGELYMRMLQATILPLIICSVIAGTANMDPASNGRLSSVSIVYIVLSNGVGAVIAVIFTLIIRPGVGKEILEDNTAGPSTNNLQTADIIADLIRNLFPDNIVSACFQKTQTVYITSKLRADNGSQAGNSSLPLPATRSLTASPGTNLLGLIIFCSVIGMASAKVGEGGRYFLLFFRSATDVITQALQWLVWFTPVGVASLIATSLIKAPDIEATFRSVGMLVLTVTVCVACHQLVYMQAVFFLARRQNPLRFLLDLSRVWITAFAPPNTVLTLPEMIRCCDLRLKVEKQISRFVLPLAVTLNRDGSCLFITASALYIGQLDPMGLDAAKVVLIAILATIGSLAVPAVPSSSVVTLLIILSSLNIPIKNIGLIMALEWYLDRIRTTSNACGCVLAVIVTERLTLSWLRKHQEEALKEEKGADKIEAKC